MPRRARVTRADDSRVRALTGDVTSRPPVLLRPQDTTTGGNVDPSEALAKRVNSFVPTRLSAFAVDAVRPQVLELLARMPDAAAAASFPLPIAFAFAVYCFHRHGSFNAARDLDDTTITEFIQQEMSSVAPGTRATHRSALRRLSRGGAKPVVLGRPRAKGPYTEGQWRALWNAAHSAGHLARDARTLLALTGAAGLHAQEVHRARPDWVVNVGDTTVVRVPNMDGEFREVPVYGRPAGVLKAAAATGNEWLFRSHFARRINATASFKILLSDQHAEWATFESVRARHYWFVRLLAAGVPFPVVCAMGGVKPGAHLVTDLLPYMGKPSISDIDRAMRRAIAQNGPIL